MLWFNHAAPPTNIILVLDKPCMVLCTLMHRKTKDAALLSFPHQQLDVSCLVEDLVPCLGDKKAKVRQAGLEAVVLLFGLVDNKDQLQQLISAIANLERKMIAVGLLAPGSVSLMGAFRARLSRESYAVLGRDGLVEHFVNVADRSNGHLLSGQDVDWILGKTAANTSLSMAKAQ